MTRQRVTSSWFCALSLIFVTAAFLLISGCTATYSNASPPPPRDYYEPAYHDVAFYDDLSYYGAWIDVYPFGMVWQPSVVSGWRPYYYGEWAWTEWGWTWISYEPFGWAAYHYGHWQYDPHWGWIWIPGDEWSPARVQWVYFDDYVCWTPLPPAGYAVADPWIAHTADIWIVVHFKHFVHRDINRYTVKLPRSAYKWKHSGVTRNKPPTVKIVERHVRGPIRRVDVKVTNVRTGNRDYKKMILQPEHKKEIESYKKQTEKKVFKQEVKKKTTKSVKKEPSIKTQKTKTQQKKQDAKTKQKPAKTKSTPKTKKKKG